MHTAASIQLGNRFPPERRLKRSAGRRLIPCDPTVPLAPYVAPQTAFLTLAYLLPESAPPLIRSPSFSLSLARSTSPRFTPHRILFTPLSRRAAAMVGCRISRGGRYSWLRSLQLPSPMAAGPWPCGRRGDFRTNHGAAISTSRSRR